MREWEREYMNNPIENGTIFKAEHLIFGTPPPIAEMDAIVGYGDLSYRATGDYKAFMILGRKGNKFYLLDVFCRRSDLATVANWMYDCDEKYRAQGFLYAEYWVEGSFIQDDFIEEFDKVGGQRSCYVPVCPDKSQKGDKHIRIEAMSRFFVAGAIIFDKRLDNESDFETFKDQLFAFEKGSGANDDAPDALQGALTKLNNKFKITAFEPELGTHTRTSGW